MEASPVLTWICPLRITPEPVFVVLAVLFWWMGKLTSTHSTCLHRARRRLVFPGIITITRSLRVPPTLKPLAADESVLIWDLSNEPQAHDQGSAANQKEFAWLKAIAATVRSCGARQPITIGTMDGGNIETYAPLCDVLCAHPYAQSRQGLQGLIAGYGALRQKHGKPMLVNECIPGCLDDRLRGECAAYYTDLLSGAGLG